MQLRAAPEAELPLAASPCHHAACLCLPRRVRRVIYPPSADLCIAPASCLPQTFCVRLTLALATLLATVCLLGFSLWYWTVGEEGLDFWREFALLTSWALFLTIVYGLLTSAVVLQELWGRPAYACCRGCRNPCATWGYMDTSFRVSANVHMWPTVFRCGCAPCEAPPQASSCPARDAAAARAVLAGHAPPLISPRTPPLPPCRLPARSINLVVLILFWSGASEANILASGNIAAHLLFPFLLLHACLYHIPVAPLGFLSALVTGALYLLVTGIYTLANRGVGPYEPGSKILNWQTGLTVRVAPARAPSTASSA